MINLAQLHKSILQFVIDKGYAPDTEELANIFKTDAERIEKRLLDLQDYHGIVLFPEEPKIWVIHPFSLAPTNFVVKSKKGLWWGNCAWCSLGVAALIQEDCIITTSIGAHGEKIDIRIENGKVIEKDLLIHFPVPMKKAWENVIYTCSTMLVFKTEKEVDEWSKIHNIPKGDIQKIDKIWEFSKKWYGKHLDTNWKKWTVREAKELFEEFDLTHEVWKLEALDDRF